jgi:cbb3-type cytochrome oxidase cytochrome c subunit
MKGLLPLFLGIFGTFAFSWAGLTFIPNYQIGHLDPQMDEEGTDIYPAPKSGMAERGRKIYVANGCVYCHSQQVRADYAASDIERKWGDRRSAPRDYIFDRPVLLGKMRLGPDLANVGKRPPPVDETAPATAAPSGSAAPAPAASPAAMTASPAANAASAPAASPTAATTSPAPPARAAAPSPSAAPAASPAVPAGVGASPAPPATSPAPAAANSTPAASPAPEEKLLAPDGSPLPYTASWHHRHLYNPHSVAPDSNMPAFRFLYEKRRIGGEATADAVNFVGDDRDKPAAGWEVVPTYDARCLVAYLMSLDQSHELKEVRSGASASAATPGKGAK